MIERYVKEMKRVERLIRKKIAWRGLVNSFAQSIPIFIYAYALYYGSYLIAAKELHFKNVIKLVNCEKNDFFFHFYKKVYFFPPSSE